MNNNSLAGKAQTRLVRKDHTIYRILEESGEEVLVIDCLKQTMPRALERDEMSGYREISEEELLEAVGLTEEILSSYNNALVHIRFTLVATVLPVLGDKEKRSNRIRETSLLSGLSVQRI